MTKIHFCYERAFHGGWMPICYHGGIPKRNSRDLEPDRSSIWTVPADMIDTDGSANFGKLMKAFPAPEVPK